MVVFPAPSSPRIRILISLLVLQSLPNIPLKIFPIVYLKIFQKAPKLVKIAPPAHAIALLAKRKLKLKRTALQGQQQLELLITGKESEICYFQIKEPSGTATVHR